MEGRRGLKGGFLPGFLDYLPGRGVAAGRDGRIGGGKCLMCASP
jgi:hypothetical protein